MMKTRLLPIVSIALVSIWVSCTRALDDTGLVEMTFHTDNSETRTVLRSGGNINWCPGDEIDVAYDAKVGKFTSTNTVEASSVDFKGSLPSFERDDSKYFLAVYPHSVHNSFTDNSVRVFLPSAQRAVEDTFTDDLFISVARTKNDYLHFYSVCGGVKFSVDRDGINRIVFKSNGGEDLAGLLNVVYLSDDIPHLTSNVDQGSTSVTLYPPQGGTFQKGRWYYLVLIPRTLHQGYTMEFYGDDYFGIVESHDPVTIKRSVWGVLKDLQPQEPQGEVVHITNVLLDKSELNLKVGERATLKLSILPENATDKTFVLMTNNADAASFEHDPADWQTITVVAKGVGKAVLSVTVADGNLSAACAVNVTSDLAVPELKDLGLSVKWASFNLGATKTGECGYYYAWGETEPYHSSLSPLAWKAGKGSGYDWPSYQWCKGNSYTMTKYSIISHYGYNGYTDGKTVLDLQDDAVHSNFGGKWRMPTAEEYDDLLLKCTWTWTTQNGVSGYRVTGPNGNYIFLPAAGRLNGTTLMDAGTCGFYWSSSVNQECSYLAWSLFTYDMDSYTDVDNRCLGYAIRPVSQ